MNSPTDGELREWERQSSISGSASAKKLLILIQEVQRQREVIKALEIESDEGARWAVRASKAEADLRQIRMYAPGRMEELESERDRYKEVVDAARIIEFADVWLPAAAGGRSWDQSEPGGIRRLRNALRALDQEES